MPVLNSDGVLRPRKDMLTDRAQRHGAGNGSGEDRLADSGDIHSKLESSLDGPGARSLHSRLVADDVEEVCVGVTRILGTQYPRSDFDEVGIEVAMVPRLEGIGGLSIGQTGGTQKGVRLANELHIGVLDAIMDHLDEVSGAVSTHPCAAGFTVDVGGDFF